MQKPKIDRASLRVDHANNLSISFADLLPSDPDHVAHFLAGAAFAMGGKEVDLARCLGVSRATLSSWKTRGAIPEAHLRWFSEEFVFAVISQIAPAPGDDFRHAGLPVVLHLARISDFNPFGLVGLSHSDLIEIFARHFGGMVRLGHLVQSLLPLEEPVDEFELRSAFVLQGLACGSAPRLFPRHMVSQ